MSARDTGTQWEKAALQHMQDTGMRLLEQNFHCRFGEIDLILRDAEGIVFTEVRYRSGDAHGDGTASVGTVKRGKLVKTAQAWLLAHPQFAGLPCRFDVIGCSGTLENPVFDWTRNAFDMIDQ